MYGTTTTNSGVNLHAFYFAWTKIFPDAGPEEFLRAVRTVTHGDDVLFSVHSDYKEFTTTRIGEVLATIGMKFTPANKGLERSEARPIEKVQFLKRGFKLMDGLYRAPLETNSSLEMCNWTTKSPDNVTATADNCKAALRELAISEPDMELQNQIIQALYQATDGQVLLPPVYPRALLKELRKNF